MSCDQDVNKPVHYKTTKPYHVIANHKNAVANIIHRLEEHVGETLYCHLNKVKKTKREKSIVFIFFLCFFYSDKHSLENYTACANIIHTKRLLYYRTSSFSGLGRRTSDDWRATAKKQSPSMQDTRVHRLLWLLFTYFGCGTYSQATPRLVNACVTVCDEFASRQLSASRSWTTVFYIYLMLKTILVPRKAPLCI